MVAGHLTEKKGYYYAVLNYKDYTGKRKSKWVSTAASQDDPACRLYVGSA